MNDLFRQFLNSRRMEYLIVDQNFNILDVSVDVRRFAESPNQVIINNDARLAFPELIGLEEILIDIIEKRRNNFNLKSIGRFIPNKNPFYIDLSLIGDCSENSDIKVVIFCEDVTERMLLEQRLVQATNETNILLSSLSTSKDYIEKLIKSMAEILIITTASGIIKNINEPAKKIFGYQNQELIDQSIAIILEDNLSIKEINDYFLSQQESGETIELVCRNKAGEKIFIAFSGSVIHTEIEGVQDFIYIGRDITQRQRFERRMLAQYITARILSESVTIEEAIPNLLVTIAESMEWELGEFWMCSSVGLQCLEIWSSLPDDISEFIEITKQITLTSGMGLPGVVWAKSSSQCINNIVNEADFYSKEIALKSGLMSVFGFPIQADGEVLAVIIFYSRERVKNLNEDILHMMKVIGSQIGIFIKRKQAESALQESEERYRDLFENASDLIQSVTPNGDFIYVNHAWQETLGYNKFEIADISVFDIIHPDAQIEFIKIFDRVISGEKIEKFQAEFITKYGQKISVEGSINCKFVDGKPVATRSILRDITQRLQTEIALNDQREQTERLLLNILPAPIADRLKQEENTIADDFAEVTVMFADIVGFTQIASSLSPIELVSLLNQIFSAFDRLCEQHNLEKIKTIGDAYMVVGGMPMRRADHAEAIAEMALNMQKEIEKFNINNHKNFSIRIGIHSGPVVAGVIGIKKFIYDLWGDTVNIASRMESHGLPGEIQVTAATYARLRTSYLFEERGAIKIKGKGEMKAFLLKARKADVN